MSIVAISENSWTLFSESSPRGVYVKEILLFVRKSLPRIKLYERTFSKIWNVTLDTILGSNFSSTEVVTEFLTCIDVPFKAL